MPTITINSLSVGSVEKAIKEIADYRKKLEYKADAIANMLAEMGYSVAVGIMANHVWTGETLNSLKVERIGEGKYVLSAQSKALLFFEFGAGVTFGGGHPLNEKMGMGPGTYPGNGHWDDPNGWWFPTDDPRLARSKRNSPDNEGAYWAHTFGNPPYKPFYNADVTIRENILKVTKEVFGND